MVQIRAFRADDAIAGEGILQRAHRVTFPYRILLARHFRMDPDLWWILEQDGRPIGVVGATAYGNFAHIGLMAIEPDAQIAGAGGDLLGHALDQLDAAGFTGVTLYSTDPGLAFYPRFGFVWSGLTTEWQLRRRKQRARTHKVTEIGDWQALLERDRVWFGADREKVFRILAEEHPMLAATAPDGTFAGYAIVQPHIVGPFAAANPEAAADLLDAALDFEWAAAPRVMLAEAHQNGEELMISSGFEPLRTSRFYVRGTAPVQQRDCLYGIAAYSLG